MKVNHVFDIAHITMDAQYDTAVFRSLEESVAHLEARASVQERTRRGGPPDEAR